MTNTRQRVVYSIVSVLMSLVLSGAFVVWYVTYSNQKWCSTLDILTSNDPHKQLTPTTAAGVQQRAYQIRTYDELVKLRGSFRCGGK